MSFRNEKIQVAYPPMFANLFSSPTSIFLRAFKIKQICDLSYITWNEKTKTSLHLKTPCWSSISSRDLTELEVLESATSFFIWSQFHHLIIHSLQWLRGKWRNSKSVQSSVILTEKHWHWERKEIWMNYSPMKAVITGH